jgi:DNA polymerase-3 subunit gamma/tau
MSYQALARRWRPNHFSDVIGQDHVVGALTAALDQDRVHHAFLFSGTRGVGKTTVARLLAKALNCEHGVSSKPCGKCGACKGVEEGHFIDLIEVDAASRTRVDDTREILDNVQYAPSQGRCKVYLIDEVHMLSTHSFNALLKTLEEPPVHVKFLLATTDPQKLPATILSRCLQFNLRALDLDQIVGNMEKILAEEGVRYDDSGLTTLARVAAGSMRDGLSLLDQAIAFGNGVVTDDQVREMLGLMDDRHAEEILCALADDDAPALIRLVQRMKERALDYIAALDDLLLVLHDISLYHVARGALEAKGSDTQKITSLAQRISVHDAQLFYQIGLYGKRDLVLAPDAASGFEMALLRMLAFRPIDEQDAGNGVDRGKSSSRLPVDPQITKTHDQTMSAAPEITTQSVHEGEQKSSAEGIVSRGGRGVDLANPDVWASLISGSTLQGVARELAMNMAPVEYKKDILTVTINTAFADLYSKERQSIIEKIVGEQSEQPFKLNLIKSSGEFPKTETPTANRSRHAEEAKAEAFQTLMQDPTIKEVIDRFDATVVSESVQPGNQRD